MDEQISQLAKRVISVESEVQNMHVLLVQLEIRNLRTVIVTLLCVGGIVVLLKALH